MARIILGRPFRATSAAAALLLAGGWIALRVHAQGAPATYPDFTNLPAPATQHRPAPEITGGGQSIALLGNLAPTNAASAKYLALAVNELNLLRPEAVFTVGNLVQGETRSASEYASEALATHALLDKLKMPWHPCAGTHDLFSGTRDPADRRFVPLFQKYFGPLYYSTDVGNVHVIVLNSEQGIPPADAIGDDQLAWLKADLDKTFDGKGSAYVVVLLHRPLWQEKNAGANWDRVHQLLVDFNRRPVVSVEGIGGGGSGARVVGVYAGGDGNYSEEPVRDGIHYVVLGATSARLTQNAAIAVRGFTLLKFDPVAPPPTVGLGVHAAVVELGGDGPGGAAAGTIVAPDIITARQRAVLDKIAALPNDCLGIQGQADPAGKSNSLKLVLANPLDVPLDVELRLASLRFLSTATLRENANPDAESFDSGWQLTSPYLGRHLEAGAHERYDISMACAHGDTEVAPPEIEFVVHWGDDRGRVHDVILNRKVDVLRRLNVPEQSEKISLDADGGWEHAIGGGTYVWNLHGDEPRNRGADWELVADNQNLYLRVKVEDATPTYAGVELNQTWGGIPSDAVSIAWAPSAGSAPAAIKRLWLLPFGPAGAELWQNRAAGEKQTALERLGEQAGIKTALAKTPEGYTATLQIPRAVILATSDHCVLNIAVANNTGGAQTWTRSWTRQTATPATWGTLTITKPPAETQPATTRSAAH